MKGDGMADAIHDMLARRIDALREETVKTAAVPQEQPAEQVLEQAFNPVNLGELEKVAAQLDYVVPRLGGIQEDRGNREKLAQLLRMKMGQESPVVTAAPSGPPIIGQSASNPMGGSTQHGTPMTTPMQEGNAIKTDEVVNPVAKANRSGSTKKRLIDNLTSTQPERDGGEGKQPNVVTTGQHSASKPSGGGNEARKLIQSNMAAIDYTKKSADSPVKKQLAQVLNEPAHSKRTDPVIGKMWSKADEVSKIASAVQRMTGQGLSNREKLAYKIYQRKLAQAIPPGGAPPAGPPPVPPAAAPPMGGMPPGGVPPMGSPEQGGMPPEMQTPGDPVAVAKLVAAKKQKDAESATIGAALAAVKTGQPPEAGVVSDEEIEALMQGGMPAPGGPAPVPGTEGGM